MALLRVYLGFAAASDHELEETAGHVIANLYVAPGLAIYPSPPFPQSVLQGDLDAFTSAIAAQPDGGKEATALKDDARAALINVLRQTAMYVQSTVQATPTYGLAQLLASGFDAVSTNRAQQPLAQPAISDIVNSGTGQLTLRVKPVANARNYEVQRQAAGGAWESAGMFQSTRKMAVTGLTPGTMYTLQVRAVGGSTGYSDWSNPVSHMSL